MDRVLRRLLRPFLVLAALVILVETWIWERLGPVVARLVELLPFARLKQAIRAGIARLPPHATLAVFAVPVALLFPFKLAALALLAAGHVLLGGLALVLAKVVGLGISAFLFDTCRPKLMQIGWFVRLYDLWLAWLVWAHRHIDPIKARIRSLLRVFAGGKAGRALRLLVRFRRVRRNGGRRGAVAASV